MIYIYTSGELEYTLADDDMDRAIVLFRNAVMNWGSSRVSMEWMQHETDTAS
jgi:hypothetical protein